MTVTIVDDLAACKKLWERLSPKRHLWERWEVCLSFYEPRANRLAFVHVEEGGEEGLLPLWFEPEYRSYTFFGGTYPENWRIWCPPKLLKPLFAAAPRPLFLIDMQEQTKDMIVQAVPEFASHLKQDRRFFLKPEKFGNTVEGLLATFSKKHRKNLLYDIRKNIEKRLDLVWEETVRLDELSKLNQLRFGADSDFADPAFVNQKQRFLHLLEKEKAIRSSVVFDKEGKVVGIEIAAFQDKVYHVLNGGYRTDYPNLGKRLIMEHLKEALRLGAEEIDFLVGDTGWKQLWNLESEPVFTLDVE